MIRPALESCGEMQDLLPGARELTRPRGFTQLVGDLSVMLGTGYGRRPHHRCQNASAHRMTSAAVEMMMPSAALARSHPRRQSREPAGDEYKIALKQREIGPRLIGLSQR
jgi:hypothetical protein